MKRKTSQTPADSGKDDSLTAADGAGESRSVGRRRLLGGGGAVVAGAVGAGVAMAASATPASAATGGNVIQGQTNNVGTDQPATEITADNSSAPTPTLILTNTGGDTTNGYASPPLRITPAASSSLIEPSANTAGGDLVATYDGNLWFTHEVPGLATFPAVVHTDANSNSFVPLTGPYRILDTRSSAGRVNVLDPSGKFDSAGRLKVGATIHIDLSLLVIYGEAVTANLTVTDPTHSGFLTLWSGTGSRPNSSSINYTTGQTIANLSSVGIAAFGSSTDTIAIEALGGNTQVILDVAGFFVGDFAQVNPGYTGLSTNMGSRAQHATKSAIKNAFTQR